jgi:hypothetical protein
MSFSDSNFTETLMKATLVSNMATLKCYMPEVHAFYQTYELSGNEVVIDEMGNVNLLNNGSLVYEDARDFAKQQVAKFCSDPKIKNHFIFEINVPKDANINFEHERDLKEITVKRRKETFYEDHNPWNEKQIDFLFMIGSGLGYQIEDIFKQKTICNFFLFEPSPEVFYAMLHCIELKSIFEHCFAHGGKFNITIGFGPENAMNDLNRFLMQYGHFNLTRLFVYKHYESDTTTKMLELINDIGHRLSMGFGFMEDEIIGISHTLANVEANYKFLKNRAQFTNQQPDRAVLLAANGPSLDGAMALIKKREQEFIVVSCGSSLKALLSNGIIPDVHIEMERTAETIPWIENIVEQELLKDIQIIALNTVCPGVLQKFKSPLLINKLFDAGGYLVKVADKLDLYQSPPNMNPTVTNCALTLFVALGFNNIYMIGTDLGFKSLDHHHSKDSMYYDQTQFSEKETLNMFNKELEVEANFGGKAFTTKVFEQSRANIELLLDRHPEVNVKNCSDGIYIDRTSPFEFAQIPQVELSQPKEEFFQNLLDQAFDNTQLNHAEIDKLANRAFKGVRQVLDSVLSITKTPIDSREQLHALFSLQFKTFIDETTKWNEFSSSINLILGGSLKYFQATVMSNAYFYTDLDKRNEYIAYAINRMNQHFEARYDELIACYNQPSKV